MDASLPPRFARSGELVVREVSSPADLEAIFQIRDEVFVREQDLTNDARHDPDDHVSIHYLAWLDGQPVGTGRLTMYGREGQIAWVAVRKAQRGSGIGKALMLALIEQARREGAAYILLNAQTHAQTFYEELEFETAGGVFHMSGIPHVVMVRRF
jgi:predicted GNAT family N-acyltransferase